MSVQQTPDPNLPDNKTFIVDANVRFTVSAFDEEEAWQAVRAAIREQSGKTVPSHYDPSGRRDTYFSNVATLSRRIARKFTGVDTSGGYSVSFLRGCYDIADGWNSWRRDHEAWTIDEHGNSTGSGNLRESFPKVTPKWVASQLDDHSRAVIESRVVAEIYNTIQRKIEAEMEDGIEVFGVDVEGNGVGIS